MAQNTKTGVLLVNLGTPDSTNTGDVRKYLREFLMDKRVIDIPFLGRWLLVNGIIAPFRAPKSAKEYRKLWDERGSPLLYYGQDMAKLLQSALGPDYEVVLAMRYQSPSIAAGLEHLQKLPVKDIIVVPMFPQYASATTGSIIDKVMEMVRTWQIIPSVQFVSQFVEHPLFIESVAERGRKYLQGQEWDHIIFSYHGLPERQIRKGSYGNYCQLGSCCNKFTEQNRYCYRAQCFHTSRQVAQVLGLQPEQYSTTFQSRLGRDPWLQPYTNEVLEHLAKDGKKRVLAFSPAFVADCLETTVEVGQEFKEEFEEAGGEHWQLVESLNDLPIFVDCLKDLVLQKSAEQLKAAAVPA